MKKKKDNSRLVQIDTLVQNLRQERMDASRFTAGAGSKIFAMMFFVPMLAFAQNNGVGGGNLCREEIEKHRAQIEGWIERDEAKDLDFSKALVKGWTYNDPAPAKSYKRVMLEVLKPGKVIVNCYEDLETLNMIASSYSNMTHTPTIGGGCINYQDEQGLSHIDCYAKTINDEASRVKREKDVDGNYRLVHHEYASIAGIERRLGVEQSDFSISNQLSDCQYDETNKVLGPFKDTDQTFGVRYEILAEKFNSAGSVTKEDLSGDYVGICFNQKDQQFPSYMSTRVIADLPSKAGGPLFPSSESVSSWRHMYWIDAHDGSEATSKSIDEFWLLARKTIVFEVFPLDEKGGAVIGTARTTTDPSYSYRFETKKGQDGHFYGRRWASGYSSDPLKIDAYCYFYKKLF